MNTITFPLRCGKVLYMYRSSVKEWQVSWFDFGTITLNGTDTVVCKYCRAVRTKRLHISIKYFCSSVCAIQSYCPQSKPADLPLFYWRPVHAFSNENNETTNQNAAPFTNDPMSTLDLEGAPLRALAAKQPHRQRAFVETDADDVTMT